MGNHSQLLNIGGVYAELWNGRLRLVEFLLSNTLLLTLASFLINLAQERSLAEDTDLERNMVLEKEEDEGEKSGNGGTAGISKDDPARSP